MSNSFARPRRRTGLLAGRRRPAVVPRLTEKWEFLPAGQAMFRERYAPEANDRMALRRGQAAHSIPATLAAIKRIAETERPG